MRVIKFRGQTNGGRWVYGSLSRAHIVDCDNNQYFVCRRTVGQFTGLVDKNGVEIFEGDIVFDENGETAYVAWLAQECGFVLVYKKCDRRLGHRNRGSGYYEDAGLEVIRNVVDNPGLIPWWKNKVRFK